jgi:EAL domain-containing protein (putative c-di-GMP-specific phosphodiesterase class I)/GGDEF domain-containing protein
MDAREIIARVDDALMQRGPEDGAVTVGLVRLNRLAEINELIGYETAGLLLDEFEERMRSLIRKQDALIQMDRHTMVLILRGISSSEHVALAAAKLQRIFERPIEVLNETIKVDVHAGFVMLDEGGSVARDVLRRAEAALRRAQEGRAPWVIGDEADSPGTGIDMTLRSRIEEGISQGEFVLYHQPKAHVGFGNIVGSEALMRWHVPGRGIISPMDFIPTAERSDLIRPLTWFALKAAVAECRNWPEEIGVAVNIAPVLLDDPALVRVVQDALAIFNVASARLTLEVTESGLASNPVRAFEVLSGLRQRGVRVAIDDFGTGYSSFAHFRDIPADELKIDRSFVSRMVRSDADARIVKAIIDLAHTFGMKVVAEGVEDDHTVERLKLLSCDYLQGFWLAKPLPRLEFREWLARKLGPTTTRQGAQGRPDTVHLSGAGNGHGLQRIS